jgi:hypothetical protein
MSKSYRVLLDMKGCKGADEIRWCDTTITDPNIRVVVQAPGAPTWIVTAKTQRSAMAKVEREIKSGGFAGLVAINEIEER